MLVPSYSADGGHRFPSVRGKETTRAFGGQFLRGYRAVLGARKYVAANASGRDSDASGGEKKKTPPLPTPPASPSDSRSGRFSPSKRRPRAPALAAASDSSVSNPFGAGYVAGEKSLETHYMQVLEEDHDLQLLLEDIKDQQSSKIEQSTARSFKAAQLERRTRPQMWIIHPDSYQKRMWDLFVALQTLLAAILVPLQLAFDVAPVPTAVLNILVDVTFIADFCVLFRTAILQEGVLIVDWREIVRIQSVSIWCYMDLIAAIPLGIITLIVGAKNHLWRLNQVLRILRLVRMSFVLKRFEESLHVNPAVVRLLTLFILLFIMWHWLGCLWIFVSVTELRAGEAFNVWMPAELEPHVSAPLSDGTVLVGVPSDLYVHGFFWATMVTSGIGYDIMPVTLAEALVTTLFSVIGFGFYVSFVGLVSNAISSIDAAGNKRRKRLVAINAYMLNKRVPLKLRKRMNLYYDYLESHMQGLDEAALLSKLPISLRRQLSIAINRKLFTKVPIFRYCDLRCLLALVERLEPTVMMPGDFAVRQNERGAGLFFINRGSVVVMRTKEAGVADYKKSVLSRSASAHSLNGIPGQVSRQASFGSTLAVSSTSTSATNQPVPPTRPSGPAAADGAAPLVRSNSLFRTLSRAGSRSKLDAEGTALTRRRSHDRLLEQMRNYEMLEVLVENDFFGEDSLLSSAPAAQSVRCRSFCDLMLLSVDRFNEVLRDFPWFGEVVQQISAEMRGAGSGPVGGGGHKRTSLTNIVRAASHFSSRGRRPSHVAAIDSAADGAAAEGGAAPPPVLRRRPFSRSASGSVAAVHPAPAVAAGGAGTAAADVAMASAARTSNTAGSAAGPSASPSAVATLVSEGFDAAASARMLALCSNDVSSARELLRRLKR